MTSHPNRSKRNPGPGARPTPAAVKAARERAGLTQTQAAELVYSTLRTWQAWEDDGPSNRPMHAGLWQLFTLKLRAREAANRLQQTAADRQGAKMDAQHHAHETANQIREELAADKISTAPFGAREGT